MLTYTQYLDVIRPVKRALEQLELDLKWHLEDIGDHAVHHVKTRIKEYEKLIRKFERGNYVSVSEITDIAGMRIVVLGQPDIEPIAGLFRGQELRKDIQIIEDVCRKDSSGYKARHLVIKIQPSYKRSVFDVFVEVQLRTLAEDLFDTLSRLMWYHSDLANLEQANPHINALMQKLEEVDEIVCLLRNQWEDAYAASASDSEMTPYSYCRIVAELFKEPVELADATEEVRFLKDRGVKLNRHLRSIFTNPDVRFKVDQLTTVEPSLFNKERLHSLYLTVVCYPQIVEVFRKE